MRTLLLDADILAYKIANAAQTVTQFPGCEPHVELEPWPDVESHCYREVEAVCETLATHKVIVCLSCPTVEGWRLGVLPTYKGNRKGVVKPVLLGKVKDYLASQWTSYARPTLEADDVMGILSTHPRLIPGEKVIVSDDKDMGTIPGQWFRPGWVGRDADQFVRTVAPDEADYFHLYQSLVGDTTDGYTGCPKVGPVKAAAALDAAATWEAVVEAYVLRGWSEEDALVQARVARICRHTDYDFKTKKVILWTPASYPCRPAEGTASTAATTASS